MDKFHLVMEKMTGGLAVALDPGLATAGRVWVVSEVGKTLELKKPVRFYMAGRVDAKVLEDGVEIASVRDCQASMPADKDRILRQIEDGVGIAAYDELVARTMRPVLLNLSLASCVEGGDWAIRTRRHMRRLLEQRADPCYSSGVGESLCFRAAQKGHAEPMQMLIQARADVDKAHTDIGATPACVAAACGHAEALQLLIQARADVDKARTSDGVTPAINAAHKGPCRGFGAPHPGPRRRGQGPRQAGQAL
jgi:hypothetical protein